MKRLVYSVTAQYQALALLGEGAAKLVDVQIGADNSDEMAIPRLQMIPTLWVPYFLGLQTPEQALKVMQQLVAGLETEELRVRTAPLVNWCLAACVKAGRAAAPKKRSVGYPVGDTGRYLLQSGRSSGGCA